MTSPKFIKKIKNKLKPSVRSQIKKEIKNKTHLEHAFIKAPRKKIKNVSSKQTNISVKHSRIQIKKYLLKLIEKKIKINSNKLYAIHTHLKTHNTIDFPSIPDLIKLPITNSKKPNIIFVTDKKGHEVGRIHYKYTQKNKAFLKEIELLNRYIDISAEKIMTKQMTYNEFNKNFNYLSKEIIEINIINYLKKINKGNNNWNGQDYINFFKEIGFNVKIIPNKNKYTYNTETLKFIKND
jgi:hypothetical protein